MSEFSRRSFLKGLLTIGFVRALPALTWPTTPAEPIRVEETSVEDVGDIHWVFTAEGIYAHLGDGEVLFRPTKGAVYQS